MFPAISIKENNIKKERDIYSKKHHIEVATYEAPTQTHNLKVIEVITCVSIGYLTHLQSEVLVLHRFN